MTLGRVTGSALVVIITLLACAERRPPRVVAVPRCQTSFQVEGAEYRGVIFPPECHAQIYHVVRERTEGYWLPSREEISILEGGLRRALEQARDLPIVIDPLSTFPGRADYAAREIGGILERLGEYRRQYAGITVDGGRRRILVNCFPAATPGQTDPYSYWTERWVSCDDGGNWYWRIQYDLGSGRFLEFDVNGNA